MDEAYQEMGEEHKDFRRRLAAIEQKLEDLAKDSEGAARDTEGIW